MKRSIFLLVIISGVILILFACYFPNLAISPGKLSSGHEELVKSCTNCHSYFGGVQSSKCVVCHKIDKIGLVKTNGTAIVNLKNVENSFHKYLLTKDCFACHQEHKYLKFARSIRRFDHILFTINVRNNCILCHKKPVDELHKEINDNCLTCHKLNKWKPATFEHNKYFVLDKDHNTSCTTCHPQNNFKAYTCYGCHEHTYEKMIEEHREESVKYLTKCVSCHKSANKHDMKKEGGSEGEGNSEDHKDND
jgi:hypothetical protein